MGYGRIREATYPSNSICLVPCKAEGSLDIGSKLGSFLVVKCSCVVDVGRQGGVLSCDLKLSLFFAPK